MCISDWEMTKHFPPAGMTVHVCHSTRSEFLRRRTISEHQRRILTNPACRDRRIGVAKARKHFHFFRSSHHPENSPRAVEYRIRQGHPAPLLINTGQGDITVGDQMSLAVVVCDGDVIVESHIGSSLVVARGKIHAKGMTYRSVLVAGEKVTVDDVNRVAKKYLQTSNRTVGVYVPTQQPQRTPIAAPPDATSVVKEYSGRPEYSVGEAFDVSPAAIEARVKRSTIEGIKVALLPKKNRGGTVNVQLRLRYGSAKSLFGMSQACEFLPVLMARATQQANSEQLADRLDELQSTLEASGGAGEATFAIQTKREHLIAVVDVLRQVLREPALPNDELEILKQRRASELEEQASEPQALAPRLISQKMNPYPAGDVRQQPSLTDELKLVQQIELATVKKVYAEFLSAQAGELVVVGDFDEPALAKSLKAALEGWKSKSPYERIARTAEQPPKPDTVRIKTPDKANATYFAGLLLSLRDDHTDYPALVMGNEVLGGSGFASRLMSRIREKEGLSYGVMSSFRSSPLDPRSTFSLFAICNPVNADKVVALAREEIELLCKDGVTDEELSDSQQGWIKGQEADRGDDRKLAALIDGSLFAGRTLDHQAKLEAKVLALKREDIATALRKHLDPAKFVNAIAGDIKP